MEKKQFDLTIAIQIMELEKIMKISNAYDEGDISFEEMIELFEETNL